MGDCKKIFLINKFIWTLKQKSSLCGHTKDQNLISEENGGWQPNHFTAVFKINIDNSKVILQLLVYSFQKLSFLIF